MLIEVFKWRSNWSRCRRFAPHNPFFTRQAVMKNHFVPQFALSYWEESDGKVPYFSRHRGRIVPGRCAPKYTGYENDLYAFSEVPEGRRHDVDKKFFSPLDNAVAPIYARLERRERFEFTEPERRVWAMYLLAGLARVPEKIEGSRKIGRDHLVRALEEDPEEYLSIRGDQPEGTLLEWVRKNEPGLLENFGLSNLTDFLADRNNLLPYMDIPWITYGVEHAQLELLLGDRPVWTHRRPIDPDFMVVLSLSPRTVFIGAKSNELIEKLLHAGPSKVVRLTNETMIQAAKLRVYERFSDGP
jgi:hypothetical protein